LLLQLGLESARACLPKPQALLGALLFGVCGQGPRRGNRYDVRW